MASLTLVYPMLALTTLTRSFLFCPPIPTHRTLPFSLTAYRQFSSWRIRRREKQPPASSSLFPSVFPSPTRGLAAVSVESPTLAARSSVSPSTESRQLHGVTCSAQVLCGVPVAKKAAVGQKSLNLVFICGHPVAKSGVPPEAGEISAGERDQQAGVDGRRTRSRWPRRRSLPEGGLAGRRLRADYRCAARGWGILLSLLSLLLLLLSAALARVTGKTRSRLSPVSAATSMLGPRKPDAAARPHLPLAAIYPRPVYIPHSPTSPPLPLPPLPPPPPSVHRNRTALRAARHSGDAPRPVCGDRPDRLREKLVLARRRGTPPPATCWKERGRRGSWWWWRRRRRWERADQGGDGGQKGGVLPGHAVDSERVGAGQHLPRVGVFDG